MCSAAHIEVNRRLAAGLCVALLSVLVVSTATVKISGRDSSVIAHRCSTRTHTNAGKQWLDIADLQLKGPSAAAEIPLPVASSFVSHNPDQFVPRFDARGLHYNRPPPLG